MPMDPMSHAELAQRARRTSLYILHECVLLRRSLTWSARPRPPTARQRGRHTRSKRAWRRRSLVGRRRFQWHSSGPMHRPRRRPRRLTASRLALALSRPVRRSARSAGTRIVPYNSSRAGGGALLPAARKPRRPESVGYIRRWLPLLAGGRSIGRPTALNGTSVHWQVAAAKLLLRV